MRRVITQDEMKTLYNMLGARTLKKEICLTFDVDERTARRMVNKLRKLVAVVSFSSQAGYRRARFLRDREDVKHTMNELKHRIRDMMQALDALEEWLYVCNTEIEKLRREGKNEQDNLDREINTRSGAGPDAEWRSLLPLLFGGNEKV